MSTPLREQYVQVWAFRSGILAWVDDSGYVQYKMKNYYCNEL